jgi:hypothetical protein
MIKKFEQYNKLNEGLSKILYHFTYIPYLINMLKINKFSTSSNLGSSADSNIDNGKFFFFSTQRTNGLSGYGKNHGNVILVLDGEKLNQRYKGFPIDYWNWSKNPKDYDSVYAYKNALLSSELEDRIITDKPYIDNAKNYILEIHINIKFRDNIVLNKSKFDFIVNSINVPVYFYDDDYNFRALNKKKSLSIEQLNLPENGEEENTERNLIYEIKNIAPIIIFGNEISDEQNKIYDIIKKYLYDLGESEKYNEIISEIENKTKKLKSSWIYLDDEYVTIKSLIHNKRGNANIYFREILDMLVKDIKKFKTKNLKEYFDKKFKSNIK